MSGHIPTSCLPLCIRNLLPISVQLFSNPNLDNNPNPNLNCTIPIPDPNPNPCPEPDPVPNRTFSRWLWKNLDVWIRRILPSFKIT